METLKEQEIRLFLEIVEENKELKSRVRHLEESIAYLETQVYNGSTK